MVLVEAHLGKTRPTVIVWLLFIYMNLAFFLFSYCECVCISWKRSISIHALAHCSEAARAPGSACTRERDRRQPQGRFLWQKMDLPSLQCPCSLRITITNTNKSHCYQGELTLTEMMMIIVIGAADSRDAYRLREHRRAEVTQRCGCECKQWCQMTMLRRRCQGRLFS